MDKTKVTGDWGENWVAQRLALKGFQVLHRQWRGPASNARGGEIDLVCVHPDELKLLFLEVKTRYNTEDLPWSSVQQLRFRKKMNQFLQHYPVYETWTILPALAIVQKPGPQKASIQFFMLESDEDI